MLTVVGMLLRAGAIVRQVTGAAPTGYLLTDALQCAARAAFAPWVVSAPLGAPRWQPPTAGPALDALLAENGPALQQFWQAMYGETQAWLAAHPIGATTLWRGLRSVPRGCRGTRLERATVVCTSVACWTCRPGLAWRYAGVGSAAWLAHPAPAQPPHTLLTAHQQPGFTSRASGVLATQVPAQRILAVPATGALSIAEEELVVLSGTLDCRAASWTHPAAPEASWGAAEFTAAVEAAGTR